MSQRRLHRGRSVLACLASRQLGLTSSLRVAFESGDGRRASSKGRLPKKLSAFFVVAHASFPPFSCLPFFLFLPTSLPRARSRDILSYQFLYVVVIAVVLNVFARFEVVSFCCRVLVDHVRRRPMSRILAVVARTLVLACKPIVSINLAYTL